VTDLTARLAERRAKEQWLAHPKIGGDEELVGRLLGEGGFTEEQLRYLFDAEGLGGGDVVERATDLVVVLEKGVEPGLVVNLVKAERLDSIEELATLLENTSDMPVKDVMSLVCHPRTQSVSHIFSMLVPESPGVPGAFFEDPKVESKVRLVRWLLRDGRFDSEQLYDLFIEPVVAQDLVKLWRWIQKQDPSIDAETLGERLMAEEAEMRDLLEEMIGRLDSLDD
jgi:hypothetical protein